ncbi:MAG: hypothetical protein FJ217_13590 [Ignavibacteria bacterium]|nr:hypothetical protein [Ignavibacteria bacterium]
MKMAKRYILLALLFGLVCVNLLLDSFSSEHSGLIGRFIPPIAILLLVFLWRRVEAKAHKRHLEHWLTLRKRGKLRFVLRHYLLLRGGILFIVLFLAFYAFIRLSVLVSIILFLTFALIVLTLFWMGLEEWKSCEEECEILALRQAAEKSRRFSALTN